jgi:putative chitinase
MPPTPFRSTQEQVEEALRQKGINKDYALKAIIANIRKESGGFVGVVENVNYKNVSNSRIREKFSFLTPENGFTDEVLNRLKTNEEAFADTIYGGRPGPAPQNYIRKTGNSPFLGNSQIGDGYKYRGRGLIQTTGKSNYQAVARATGKDVVNNPDLLITDFQVSIDAAVLFLNTSQILQARNLNGEYNTPSNLRNAAVETFRNGISGMNAFVNQNQANRAVTAAIGGSVEFIQSGFGAELLARVNQFTGTSGGTGGIPSTNSSAYFENTYIKPIEAISANNTVARNYLNALKSGSIKVPSAENKSLQDTVNGTPDSPGAVLDIGGELALIGATAAINVEYQQQQASVISRIDGLLPAEAAFAVQYDLFEFYPDKMREAMSINAGNSINPLYSHAWRSPGKLAITANITIPGIAGFSIGQIFRIGRTYDYNKQGAFQLFGLTETIDVSRGWTTELYARFNAMPLDKIDTLQSE